MQTHYPVFINGEFVETPSRQKIVNPSTGRVITEVALASEKEAQEAISAARLSFDQGPWPKISLEERKDYLLKIARGILDKAGELAQIESLNTGKPIKESTFMDIPSSAETFQYFAQNLQRFLEPHDINISSPVAAAQAFLAREPYGVALLIVPWNYPLLIASWKLAQALAAGNTVVLKPSSLTPLTVLELAKIIKDIGLPRGVVNVISGSGDKVGRVLCSDKRVDLISFTGSNEVGKKIIEYSATNVKKLIMELGGKSASLIFQDADLESAVNGSLCSIFLNQGQMCTAMSRIFVQDSIYERFLSDFVAKAKRIKLGDALDSQTQMGPLISVEQRKKILSFVERAKREGAKLVLGGKIPEAATLRNGFFFEPAIFVEVTPKMSIFKEEVFGPVVCIGKFSSEEQAIELANASDFALASCIWTRDETRARQIPSLINAGTVWVNTYGMFFNELAYGGFKQSGFGKELGREGFLEYSRLKNTVFDKTSEAKPLVNYWYGF